MHQSNPARLALIKAACQSAQRRRLQAVEPGKRCGPKESTTGLDKADEAWMRHYQLPREERARNVHCNIFRFIGKTNL